MSMRSAARSVGRWAMVAGTVTLAACTAPGGPGAVSHEFPPPADGGSQSSDDAPAVAVTAQPIKCAAVQSAQPMPARTTIVDQTASGPPAGSSHKALVSDL